MSIHTALEAALAPGSLAPRRFDTSVFCGFKDFESLSPETRREIAANPHESQSLGGYRAVSGHFSLRTLLRITDASSISTVLREPRTRLLSLYLYWRTPGIFERWSPYRVNTHALRPLATFLSERHLAPVIDNQICRMLLHGDPRLPESDFVARSDIQGVAADAVDRLDELGFVGVLELGDSAWQGVARLFGVTLDQIRVNVTGEALRPIAIRPGEELVTAGALDLIEQRSAADLLVYEQVLIRTGLNARERGRLRDRAFAHQLVKLGDLVGHSAAHAAEQAWIIEMLSSRLEERERSGVEVGEVSGGLGVQERTIQELKDEIGRRDAELDKLGRWLEAVRGSVSWRLTAPLRVAKRRLAPLAAENISQAPSK